MLIMSWHRPSEGEIQEAWASKYQLMSNSCALAALTIKKKTKQEFNYMTAKLIKCNINNKYDSSSAVESAPNYKKTEKDKREVKKREETAFILD